MKPYSLLFVNAKKLCTFRILTRLKMCRIMLLQYKNMLKNIVKIEAKNPLFCKPSGHLTMCLRGRIRDFCF